MVKVFRKNHSDLLNYAWISSREFYCTNAVNGLLHAPSLAFFNVCRGRETMITTRCMQIITYRLLAHK